MSKSEMPPLACGQRWESETELGPEFLTIGVPGTGPHNDRGFEVYFCNLGASQLYPWIERATLRANLIANKSRLVAGPGAPWSPEETSHA